MSTASCAVVATLLAMVRTLLFICWGQLLVATLNTVEAKETKETQNRQGRTTTQGWTEYSGKYYTISDCPYGASSFGNSLETCKRKCADSTGCTAVNFRNSQGWCRLVKCQGSGTEPSGSHSDYTAYAIIEQPGCLFGQPGEITPPGEYLKDACARLKCDGRTGKFNFESYNANCPRCIGYWDPHIMTYDFSSETRCNLDGSINRISCGSYAYNKCGNYSLTQIGNTTDPTVAVYATFKLCEGRSQWDLTCVDTVTFKNDEDTSITIGVNDDENDLEIEINGANYVLSSSTPITITEKSTVLAWKEGLCVSLQGSSGLLVKYCGDPENKANYVHVWPGPTIDSKLKGLCGTDNGNKEDDFTTRDGSRTWQYSTRAPDEFGLSWLAIPGGTGNCDGGRNGRVKIQAENNCVADPSLLDTFVTQCTDAVSSLSSIAPGNLIQTLLDDCVYDLCNVTNPGKWMKSIEATVKVQAEIQKITVVNITTTIVQTTSTAKLSPTPSGMTTLPLDGQGATTLPLTPVWKEYPGKYHTSSDCPWDREATSWGVSLETCKRQCINSPECTIIDFHNSGGVCGLVNCPVPAPAPSGSHSDWTSYAIIEQKYAA